MTEALVCWKCGASLDGLPRPLSRRAECGACGAELHVCRLCQYYNPRVSEKCDEPKAEHPREQDRANFCDYFKPKPGAYVAPDDAKTQAARAQLDGLFGAATEKGGVGPAKGKAHEDLEDLFGSGEKKNDKP